MVLRSCAPGPPPAQHTAQPAASHCRFPASAKDSRGFPRQLALLPPFPSPGLFPPMVSFATLSLTPRPLAPPSPQIQTAGFAAQLLHHAKEVAPAVSDFDLSKPRFRRPILR